MTNNTIVDQSTFQSSAISPVKRTLLSETDLIILHLLVTTGAVLPERSVPIKVFYTTSPFDVTASAAPAAFAAQASVIEIPISSKASQPIALQSEEELAAGSFFYAWTDTPNLSQAIALRLDLTEI